MMYLPYLQNARSLNQMRVIVQTRGDPAALAPAVRRILHELEPTLPVTAVEPIRAQMGRSIARERFTALVSMFFGAVALLLAALGMFAMASHAVVTRTSEIGIRMALGGTRTGVLRMIVRESLVIVGAGSSSVCRSHCSRFGRSRRVCSACRLWTRAHSEALPR